MAIDYTEPLPTVGDVLEAYDSAKPRPWQADPCTHSDCPNACRAGEPCEPAFEVDPEQHAG